MLKLHIMRSKQSDLLPDQHIDVGFPRVKRVGRWLRKFRLDAVSHLYNIIHSEMFSVGRWPHAPNERASGKLLMMHRRTTSSGIKSGRELRTRRS